MKIKGLVKAFRIPNILLVIIQRRKKITKRKRQFFGRKLRLPFQIPQPGL